MIRKDDLGNLYTFSDNGWYFVIKNILKVKGTFGVGKIIESEYE